MGILCQYQTGIFFVVIFLNICNLYLPGGELLVWSSMLLKGLGVGSRGRPASPSCGGAYSAQGGLFEYRARGGQVANESSDETDDLITPERAF
jgi:hypothetical protein